MRKWPCLGWPLPHKLPRPSGGLSLCGSQDPVLPVLSVMGHWVQELFGTHSSFTPIIAEQKCIYGHVWGDPVPPNCRVLRADGHFTVARTLYYPSCITHTMSHAPPGPRATWYKKHLYTHYGRTEMRIWPSSGWPCPSNCCVLGADGHFTVARTLYYLYYESRIPGTKGYLVHIAPLHLKSHNRNAHIAKFLVTLSPKLPRP